MYAHLPFYFINVMIHAGAYVFFILMPFQSKLRYPRNTTSLYVIFWILFTASLDILFFELDAPFTAYIMPMTVIWLAVTASIMLLLIKASPLQLVFVLLLIFSFQKNIIYCARLIYAEKPLPAFLPWFGLFNYLLYTIAVTIAVFPFLWYLFKQLQKIIDTKIDFLQWKYLFLLPFSYYLYCEVSQFGGINLNDPRPQDFIQLLLLNSFAYFSYIAVLKMLLKSYDNYKITEQVTVMGKQLEMQKAQYQQLKDNISKASRLRHDWRHHLLLIKNYVDNYDREGLRIYLEHYFEEFPLEDESPVCANGSVDIILRHYLMLAKAGQIETEVSVAIPSDFPISDHKLCIVFGNLVENAVEGCLRMQKGRRFLSIRAKTVGDQIAIIVQNSYNGPVNRKGEEFLSTKHEGTGIGISSVKNIAEKSGGSFHVSCDKDIFKVSVFLCTSESV